MLRAQLIIFGCFNEMRHSLGIIMGYVRCRSTVSQQKLCPDRVYDGIAASLDEGGSRQDGCWLLAASVAVETRSSLVFLSTQPFSSDGD